MKNIFKIITIGSLISCQLSAMERDLIHQNKKIVDQRHQASPSTQPKSSTQPESSPSGGAGVVLDVLGFAADVATTKVITDIHREQDGDLVVQETNLIGETRTTEAGNGRLAQENNDLFTKDSAEIRATDGGIQVTRGHENKCLPCLNYEYSCGPEGCDCTCGMADQISKCCNGTDLLLRQCAKGSLNCLKNNCPNPTQICEVTRHCCDGTASLVVDGCRRTGECLGDCLGNCPNPGELCDAMVSCVGTMGECIAVPFQCLFAVLECLGEILDA